MKIVTFFLVLICLSIDTNAQSIAHKIEQYLSEISSRDDFSGNVFVSLGGEVIFSKSYGFANKGWNMKNDMNTVFRIGSLSKQFTAAAILLLEQQNELSVEDKLSKFIKDYPRGDEISLYHLLTHTSGIVSVTNPGVLESNKVKITTDQLIDRFKHLPLEFEPGSEYRYSNSGYILLARIVELITGKEFHAFLKTEILEPLGMFNTGADESKLVIPNRAAGYVIKKGIHSNAEYIDMHTPKGGGSLIATVGDLYIWDRALYSQGLFHSETLRKMFTPNLNNYAYGWGVREISGERAITHSGGINGFSANIMRFPEKNTCIIVLSNNQLAQSGAISRTISEILFLSK